jgi:signal transduction histidine kinase
MIDIKTLAFAATAIYLFQALMLHLISKYIAAYRDIHCLSLGSLMFSLGCLGMLLREFDSGNGLLIFFTNFFQVGSMIIFDGATRKMLNSPVYPKIIIPVFVSYLILISFLTFFYNSFSLRIVSFSLIICLITLSVFYTLLKKAPKTIKSSANLLAAVFLLFGLFFLARAIFALIVPLQNDSFNQNNFLHEMALLIGSSFGFFWTMCLIILKNQMLFGDLIKKTEEMEVSTKEKANVLSILGHDLRSPIYTLTGLTDILADEQLNINTSKYKEIISSMQRTAHSTCILLDNLLDWSRMRHNETPFNPQPNAVNECMSEVMGILGSTAESKNIRIIDRIPPGTIFIADKRMCMTVFRNILSNAIKFTPKNGEIVLELDKTATDHVIFSIRDNGIGMDSKTLKTLFDSSFNNNRNGTNGESSIGLGLILCKDFIDKHKGKIWVESEPNKGSTFHFTFSS